MKKWLIWLFLGILALFLILFLIGLSSENTNTTKTKERAKDKIDEECSKMPDFRLVTRCYEDTAVNLSDPLICQRIPIDKEDCIYGDCYNWRDTCYNQVAEKAKNSSICDFMLDGRVKDGCYMVTGIDEKNPSACDKINSIETRDTCFSLIVGSWNGTDDQSLCGKIQKQLSRDFCYAGVAHDLKNISICEKIEGDVWKKNCYGYFQK